MWKEGWGEEQKGDKTHEVREGDDWRSGSERSERMEKDVKHTEKAARRDVVKEERRIQCRKKCEEVYGKVDKGKEKLFTVLYNMKEKKRAHIIKGD